MRTDQQKKIKRKLKSWMVLNGITGTEISHALGYRPGAGAVSHFIIGRITAQKIRQYLLEKGCPERLLDELEKLRKEA